MQTIKDLSIKAQVCIAMDRVETFVNRSNYQIAKEIAEMIGVSVSTVLYHVNKSSGTPIAHDPMSDVN